jgi:protein-tyrosine phosphatase
MPERDLAWPTCFNTRDLGGYMTGDGRRTRWGAVVRADNMVHLDADGQAALVDYGVRTVVDLRCGWELRLRPRHPFHANTAADATPRYVHAPVVDDADQASVRAIDAASSRDESYRLMLALCRAQIAAALRAIADAPPGGVLLHCHSGTDRTGLVAALLLAVVGVPTATIVDDYAHSHERLGAFYDYYRARIADPEGRARFQRVTAPPELMAATLSYLEAEHGGAVGYLSSAGLTDAELQCLRGRLVASRW